MEPVGFAVGVVGLAGLFSVCLDAVERFDAWKKFDADLTFLGVRVEAERLRLDKWGRSVGFKPNTTSGGADGYDASRHHAALDDERTAATVKKLLMLLQAICVGKDGALFAEDAAGIGPPMRHATSNHFGVSTTSRRARIKWALKDKATCMAQVDQIEILVQKLHDLVPPHGAGVGASTPTQPYEQALDQLGDILANKDEFRSMVLEIERSLKAETAKELCAWLLGRHTPNEVYETALQRKLDNTCQWILDRQEYLDWASSSFPDSSAKYLWIHGPAAFGKTVLCATLVQHMRSVFNSPLAYYFLSSDFESRSDPFVAVRSWLVQLSSEEIAFDLLRARWESSRNQAALTGDVIEAFKELVQALPECTLVIDGLDECTSDGNSHGKDSYFSVADFLNTINQIVSDSKARILVTSREDPVIRQGIMGNAQAGEYKISPEDVRSDIDEYSRDIINKKLPKKDATFREELSHKIAERCEGQFLWIRFQSSNLRSWKNKKQLEAAIDKVPTGLEHLYERNWDRIQNLDPEESERAYAMLRWIAFAIRPLTVAELTEALLVGTSCDFIQIDEMPDSLDEDYVDNEILRVSGSLLEIRGSVVDSGVASQTVHFTHFSAKQYFIMRISEKMDTLMVNERLRSSVEVACNNELALKCLHYISMPHIWHFEDDGSHPVYRSFRGYAGLAWYDHAALSDHDAVVRSSNGFFTRKDSVWKSWQDWFDLQVAAGDEAFEAADEEPLYYAVLFNLIETVKYLLDSGVCDVNRKTRRFGDTLLQAACSRGHLEMAMVLLDAGADVLMPGLDGETALYDAARIGHNKLLEVLLDRGSEIDSVTSYGCTPLHSASIHGNVDAVRTLLKHGADVSTADEYGDSALHCASIQGHLEVAKMLLDGGANVNAVTADFATPLHRAAAKGHVEVVKILLEFGADFSAPRANSRTALELAVLFGHARVVELLLDAGSEIRVDSIAPPLVLACSYGNIEIARILLAHGADTSSFGPDSYSALHASTFQGHIGIIELLLAEGVDVNSKTVGSNISCLHIAAQEGHTEIFRFLLAHGADTTLSTEHGMLPLHLAILNNNLSIFNLLIEEDTFGIGVATSKGWLPIHYAASYGHAEMIQILIDCGADATAVDAKGTNSVQLAAQSGHEGALRLLIKHGVDTLACRSDGWNPLHIASYYGHADIVRALLEHDEVAFAINAMTPAGLTAAFLAAAKGKTEVMKVLLNCNADIEKGDKNGWTTIFAACRCGQIDVVKLLLGAGANLSVKAAGGYTALHVAMMSGVSAIVEMLLDNGMDMAVVNQQSIDPAFIVFVSIHNHMPQLLDAGLNLDIKGDDGETAMHFASQEGHVEAIKVLLEKGVAIEAVDAKGNTPLMIACYYNHVGVVALLLSSGANVDACNHVKDTPLHVASHHDAADIAKLLLDKGAIMEAQDNDGNTPLIIAASRDNSSILSMLIEAGADLESRDNDGSTTLHIVSQHGHAGTVALLLERGADMEAVNTKNRTPLMLAAAAGNSAVVERLLDNVDGTRRACLDIKDMYGQTAISFAVRMGHQDIANMFLSTGNINLLSEDDFGRTPLSWAKMLGSTNMGDFFSLKPSDTTDDRPEFCDVCTLSIPKSMGLRTCGTCNVSDSYDICETCYSLGARCRNKEHSLVEMPPEST
ncbi:hypothetical protein NLG97_g6919 [Lecanicillium saksenae]|uniref:Uncharacterized protein n=1 Tax=Lecanicillium saksenae TaxID=468837 RepID=A0ACC1QRD5_9HYPO|nr:hypothetical protein NLG97_g6919 [Lecanicillium saksenae]